MARRGVATIPAYTIRALERLWGWPFWLGPMVIAGLRRRGYLRRTDDGYELTPAGAARGARIARNHRLWEQYLQTYADVAPGHVDWSADTVEHVLSPELVAELEAALKARGALP